MKLAFGNSFPSIICALEHRVYFLHSVFDLELVVVVSNLKSDKTTRKLVLKHNQTTYVIYVNPRNLSKPLEKLLAGLVKDFKEMGQIEKGAKAFAHNLLQLSM